MAGAAFLVVLVVLVTFVVQWFLKLRKTIQLVDKIHGPRYLPIVGSVLYMKTEPTEFFEQLVGTGACFQSPRMYRVWMFTHPFVVITGAEEAEVILSSNRNISKGVMYHLLHPWMGLGLLTSEASQWRPRRKLLTPTFHYEILKDFVEVFNHQSRVLLRKLDEQVELGNEKINMYQYVTLCALDIICETAMGRHVDAQKDSESAYVRAIYTLNGIIHRRQKNPLFWSDFIHRLFGEGKEQEKCLSILHSFTWKVIKERREEVNRLGGWPKVLNRELSSHDFDMCSQKRRLAFLDLLLQMTEQGNLTDQDVCEEVDTFMFEGHDTTSTAMNWFLHLVGCSPEIQAKIHDELDAIFGDDDRDVTFEDLKSMTYLECCIKEVLRLFPSVPIFARRIDEDFEISGRTIPRGSEVLICPYIVHRDPKHWPDPECFDPDRFLPKNSHGRHPYAYLPFSAGSRNCIGQRFALIEEKVLPKAELIVRPSETIFMKLTRRQVLPS